MSPMKIAFVNPPMFENADGILRKWVRAGSRWPHSYPASSRADVWMAGNYVPYPFFLGYAASYVAKHTGTKVVLRDSVCLHESYASFWKWLQAERPDFVFFESASPSWEHDRGLILRINQFLPEAKIVICGPITALKGKEILAELPVVACIKGEYEKNSVKVINGATGILEHDLLTTAEMNAAPFPLYDASTVWKYYDGCPPTPAMPHAHVWASRGCPFKCLHGDTPVNTVYGAIPIRELAEKYKEIGVFTYDPSTQKAKVSTARNIMKLGENERLVRVRLDDGTHMDMTPDHKLLVFKNGNQFKAGVEWEVQAADLKPGMRIRSLRSEMTGEYPAVAWSRKGRMATHRMVAEWKIGRSLRQGEHVHHIDRNKFNYAPENLVVMANAKEHFAQHPEISERMISLNPTRFGMSDQWKQKVASANTGKKRSAESKERYRSAAIAREASKSEGQKREDAQRMLAARDPNAWMKRTRNQNGQFITNQDSNHRVVSVEPLAGLHDVYCLEVPETNWFFANGMLVRNCVFCVWPSVMTGNDPEGESKRSVRFYSKEYMLAFLTELVGKYRLRSIYFDDDTFNLGNKHTQEMCEVMRKINLPWAAMCRADTSTRETWKMMRDSGCYGVKVGIESGSQYVVNKIVNKGLDLEEARQTVIYLRSLGMSVHGTFTYGLPGETVEQMQETKAYIARTPFSTIQESGTAEIEGTPLHTLRTRGHLDAYPGATLDGFSGESDGVKKFQTIKTELAAL
jgi:hypothetical protein